MRTPPSQYFSLDEYRQRLDALRRRMESKGVDAMLVNSPENLYYLTGYQTPGYYWFQTLIVPMDREPVFIVRLNESSNIEPLTWIEDSRPYEDRDDWIAHTGAVLRDLGLDNRRLGLQFDSFFLTIRDERRLMTVLPSATLVDCSGLVEEGRVIPDGRRDGDGDTPVAQIVLGGRALDRPGLVPDIEGVRLVV